MNRKNPTARDLSALLKLREGPCASIFLRTHRASAATRQDPIRFRKLVGEAEATLDSTGTSTPLVNHLLFPARRLLDDREFWRHQKDGLAYFAAADDWAYWLLPYQVPERVAVADHFVIRPLLPLVNRYDRFYVLAISRNHSRLYEGWRDELTRIDVPDAPEGLADLLAFVEVEKSLQFVTGTAPAPGRRHRAAIFHGQGAPEAKHKKRALELFQALDRALRKVLGNSHAPLVPMGEERTVALFREATTYPHVTSRFIRGNPDHDRIEDHLDQAMEIVRPIFNRVRREAMARYEEAASKGLGSRDLAAIVPAAAAGHVDTMLADAEARVSGSWDETSGRLEIHKVRRRGDRDLVEYAVVKTLEHGGRVFELARDEMPDDRPTCAILRRGATVGSGGAGSPASAAGSR